MQTTLMISYFLQVHMSKSILWNMQNELLASVFENIKHIACALNKN